MRTRLAQLIAHEEGFGRAGVLPTIRHNEGDLRHAPGAEHPGGPGHENDIATFQTDEQGWAALERQLQLDARRGLTLRQAIEEWAPPSDGNDTARYLADVVAGFHGAVTPDWRLAQVLTIQGV